MSWWSFYSTAEVDALLADIDRLVWADSAGMPLYQFPSITAGVLWNVWEWKPAR